MSVKFEGLEDLLQNFNEFLFDTNKALDEGVFAVANDVRNTAIKSIQTKRDGRTVTRYTANGNPYSHVAAKAGGPPNTDTGDLVKSIAVEHEKGSQVAFVGTDMEHGAWLEVTGWPWLEPAKESNIGNMKNQIAKAIKRQIDEV